MRIRLVRKLAECLDGVDLSSYRTGELIDLPQRDADLMVAERWAVPVCAARRCVGTAATALTRLADYVHRVARCAGGHRAVNYARRRVEDRIRDELQDARAITIKKLPRRRWSQRRITRGAFLKVLP